MTRRSGDSTLVSATVSGSLMTCLPPATPATTLIANAVPPVLSLIANTAARAQMPAIALIIFLIVFFIVFRVLMLIKLVVCLDSVPHAAADVAEQRKVVVGRGAAVVFRTFLLCVALLLYGFVASAEIAVG